MNIPTDFRYATTLGFWISLLSIFINDLEWKKILLSYSFGIGVSGLIYQYNKNKNEQKSIAKNIIDYVIPILISIYYCSKIKNNDLNFKIIIPFIFFYFYVYLNKIDLDDLYYNYLFYNNLSIIIILTYYIYIYKIANI